MSCGKDSKYHGLSTTMPCADMLKSGRISITGDGDCGIKSEWLGSVLDSILVAYGIGHDW